MGRDPMSWISRACQRANRNMSQAEWEHLYGQEYTLPSDVPRSPRCRGRAGEPAANQRTTQLILPGVDTYFFYITPMTDMVIFATLIFFAYRARRDPSAHKRIIYIATVGILIAAIARFHLSWLFHIHTKAEWLKEMEQQKDDQLLFKDFRLYDLRLVRFGPSVATMSMKRHSL